MSSSVDFWYRWISLSTTVPGLYLIGLLRPPVLRALPRFFCATAAAFATFFLAFSLLRVFQGRVEAKGSRGCFPVDLRAVVLVLIILFHSLKYKEFLGTMHFPDWVAISRDRSFPFNFLRPLEVEGWGSSTLLLLVGEGSGVVWVLVFGVEMNSEQFSTKSQSEQPVWSSTGATKHKRRQLVLIGPKYLTRISNKLWTFNTMSTCTIQP